MRTAAEIKRTIEVGLGRKACDLKLTNLNLVNVYANDIYPTDICIAGGRIVSIDPKANLKAKKTMDCGGRYALPGFIDGHIHIETTLLAPESLGEIIVPQGSTTLCIDPMEIANVAGIEGVKELMKSISQLPYRVFLEIPSRVPTAPGLETAGAVVGLDGIKEALEWPETISLGELDPSKILFVMEEYLEKIAATLAKRRIVNGHAIGRTGQELNVYASAGIADDHECVYIEELKERLRLGMSVMVREGSSERNVDELMAGVVKEKISTENLLFCTDDKHASDILREGHINYNVNRAIKLGLSPMEAIKMATINAAKHFRLEDEIGSITPGRLADILLVDSLEDIQPSSVFFGGDLVFDQGQMKTKVIESVYPDSIKQTVSYKRPVTKKTFRVASSKQDGQTEVNVIRLKEDQIINDWTRHQLKVSGGEILPDLGADVLKLAVVERHGRTDGNVGVGFVQGFKLEKGALASSVSHDHHNVVCVGTNDEDMALAVRYLEKIQGGFVCVAEGKVLGHIELPIAGLMSLKDAPTVIEENEALNDKAASLGCPLNSPFMSLSFISLPTVPELGLTDMGLIDVLAHKIIEVEK